MWSEGQLILVGVLANDDSFTRSQRIAQQQFTNAIFDVGLDGTLQRTGTKLHVVTLDGHKLLRFVSDADVVPHVLHTLEERLQFNIDDLLDGIEAQLVEGDDLVETIQELRRELLAQALLYNAACASLSFSSSRLP